MPTFNRFYRDPSGNISPAVLQQLGPILTVEVSSPAALAQLLASQGQSLPAPATGWALIDTGATRTCVHEQVLVDLRLNPIGVVTTGTAQGPVQRLLFPARLTFPAERLDIEFESVVAVDLTGQVLPVTQEQPTQRDIIVLVGRDVLQRCVFTYNGPGGFFTLSY